MFKFFAQVWGRTWESWRRTPIIQRTLLFCQNIALLIRSSLQSLWRAQLPRIAFLVLSTMIVGGLVVLGIERHHNEQFKDVEDALWWALITVTTTGYGDKFPITGWGRIVTGLLIFTEMGLVSVFTATIASALTERRLKEARGLGKITSVGHIAICGWNPNADNLIGKLTEVGHTEDIVLVNTLSEEVVQDVILRHPDASIRFVRGDFSMESTLRQANVGDAAAVILLADVVGGDQEKADERTILGTLSVKSINREIMVCAQLLSKDNEPHLQRAGVDDIIFTGDYTGYLLASSACSPGLTQVIKDLLTTDRGNVLKQVNIPKELVGRKFLDLLLHFRRSQVTPVAIISQNRGMSMEDMLTDDFSFIDQFIKRKFSEAGKEALFHVGGGTQVQVNPPDDYVIEPDDRAVVITLEKENQP